MTRDERVHAIVTARARVRRVYMAVPHDRGARGIAASRRWDLADVHHRMVPDIYEASRQLRKAMGMESLGRRWA